VYVADCSANLGFITETCAFISVDTNGNSQPNTLGRDLFVFYLTKKNIIPMGLPGDTLFGFENYCKDKDKITPSGFPNGNGCTAWVLHNENLDYLNCKDLDWNTKTKCN
jgi:hypothetical protein